MHLLLAASLLVSPLQALATLPLTLLDAGVAATGDGLVDLTEDRSPSSGTKRKRETDKGLVPQLISRMDTMSKASLYEQLTKCRTTVAEFEVKALIASSDEEKQIWERQVNKIQQTENEIVRQLHSLA